MYRAWSGIDTGGDQRPVQGQCTDHSWIPWASPYAPLAAAATAAAATSAAAEGIVSSRRRPSDDVLWELDGLSWPPPLEVAACGKFQPLLPFLTSFKLRPYPPSHRGRWRI